MELSVSESILRLLLALALGSVVGFEREISHQSAGLRTHILVCLGSAVFTLVSISTMMHDMTPIHAASNVMVTINHDTGRIAAQVVSGIGFIGGGAVLRHGANVRGLTTAASLWMIASIGMLCGVGDYYLAMVSTLLSFLVLFTIGALEHSLFKKDLRRYTRMRIQLSAPSDNLPEVQKWFEDRFAKEVVELKSTKDSHTDIGTLTYVLDVQGVRVDVNDFSRQINQIPNVSSANIKVYHDMTEQ